MNTEIWDDNKISDKVLKLGELWFKRVEPKYNLKVELNYKGRKKLNLNLTGVYKRDVRRFLRIFDRNDNEEKFLKLRKQRVIRSKLNSISTKHIFLIINNYSKVKCVLIKNIFLPLVKFKNIETLCGESNVYTINVNKTNYGANKIDNKGSHICATYKDYTALFFNYFSNENIVISGLV